MVKFMLPYTCEHWVMLLKSVECIFINKVDINLSNQPQFMKMHEDVLASILLMKFWLHLLFVTSMKKRLTWDWYYITEYCSIIILMWSRDVHSGKFSAVQPIHVLKVYSHHWLYKYIYIYNNLNWIVILLCVVCRWMLDKMIFDSYYALINIGQPHGRVWKSVQSRWSPCCSPPGLTRKPTVDEMIGLEWTIFFIEPI